MPDSHPGIHLAAVLQLMVIVDPFRVYCPELLAQVPKLSSFSGCPVQSNDNVSDTKRLYENASEYIQLT